MHTLLTARPTFSESKPGHSTHFPHPSAPQSFSSCSDQSSPVSQRPTAASELGIAPPLPIAPPSFMTLQPHLLSHRKYSRPRGVAFAVPSARATPPRPHKLASDRHQTGLRDASLRAGAAGPHALRPSLPHHLGALTAHAAGGTRVNECLREKYRKEQTYLRCRVLDDEDGLTVGGG